MAEELPQRPDLAGKCRCYLCGELIGDDEYLVNEDNLARHFSCPDRLDVGALIGNLEAVGLRAFLFDESGFWPPHTRVRHGQCPVCGHYGDSCTGVPSFREED